MPFDETTCELPLLSQYGFTIGLLLPPDDETYPLLLAGADAPLEQPCPASLERMPSWQIPEPLDRAGERDPPPYTLAYRPSAQPWPESSLSMPLWQIAGSACATDGTNNIAAAAATTMNFFINYL